MPVVVVGKVVVEGERAALDPIVAAEPTDAAVIFCVGIDVVLVRTPPPGVPSCVDALSKVAISVFGICVERSTLNSLYVD